MKTLSLVKTTAFVILMATNYFTIAEILVYPFSDPIKEERFNVLIKELRCPKCQNNNLADSNAPLAVDLKDIVYEKVNLGQSDDEIISYLKERYGDFISYRPPVKPSTWLIWYGPFALLLIGVFLIFRFVSLRQKEESEISEQISTESSSSQSSKDLLEQWNKEIGNSK